MARATQDVQAWLRTRPTLNQVREAYPQDWEVVSRRIGALVERGDPDALRAYLTRAAIPAQRLPGRQRRRSDLVTEAVQQYMTLEALNQAYLSATTGVTSGKIKFGRVDGWLLQRLLFERGLTRKPANLTLNRLAWPLLRQRARLMPLVRPFGIYCFYSWPLVKQLARLIDGRQALEIGAGDGTLAGFLRGAGAHVTATDDHSWSDAVKYPSSVLDEDAVTALRTRSPELVICSWPPPGNDFERHVFTTPSVREYVVITSRHEAAAGNWDAYRHQNTFDWSIDEHLSSLLLPPTGDHAVLIFRRTPPRSRN